MDEVSPLRRFLQHVQIPFAAGQVAFLGAARQARTFDDPVA
ncbi:hypothetical protein QA640_37190 [Bradyrhizobium sp. CB82]|nr:hypothetical protein [Bradyrhizobium sp. CB82]WFU39903.1 hypothetical protein QA640_37190 [Bradyrhizobium sp. CB82]